MQNLLLLLPALGERQTQKRGAETLAAPHAEPPSQSERGARTPQNCPRPHHSRLWKRLRNISALPAQRAPRPAYAPLAGSEGPLAKHQRLGRDPELWSDPSPLRRAARARLERGAETPTNSETEQRSTGAAGGGRGGRAARWGAAHRPRSRAAAPFPSPGLRHGAPASAQPLYGLGSGAGTGDVERGLQSSDPLKEAIVGGSGLTGTVGRAARAWRRFGLQSAGTPGGGGRDRSVRARAPTTALKGFSALAFSSSATDSGKLRVKTWGALPDPIGLQKVTTLLSPAPSRLLPPT